MLHHVPYIKDEKLKIQHFLGCLPPNFWERIEFDMPKNMDTILHKARILYEHMQLRKENINRSRDRSRTFSDNHKLGFNPPPYRKENNIFPTDRKFNKIVWSQMCLHQMPTDPQQKEEPMFLHCKSNAGNAKGPIIPEIVKIILMRSCTIYKKNQW